MSKESPQKPNNFLKLPPIQANLIRSFSENDAAPIPKSNVVLLDPIQNKAYSRIIKSDNNVAIILRPNRPVQEAYMKSRSTFVPSSRAKRHYSFSEAVLKNNEQKDFSDISK